MRNILILLLFLIPFLFSSCQEKSDSLKVVAGTGNAGFNDGKQAALNKPIRLAPYENNSVIFADINNHAIRIATLDGYVTTIAGSPEKKAIKMDPHQMQNLIFLMELLTTKKMIKYMLPRLEVI